MMKNKEREVITFHATVTDNQRIEELAAASGKSISKYIIESCLNRDSYDKWLQIGIQNRFLGKIVKITTQMLIEWKKTVITRDKKLCTLCETADIPVVAHHIRKISEYPEKILDIDNGITLCKECHRIIQGNEEHFAQEFELLIIAKLKKDISAIWISLYNLQLKYAKFQANRLKSNKQKQPWRSPVFHKVIRFLILDNLTLCKAIDKESAISLDNFVTGCSNQIEYPVNKNIHFHLEELIESNYIEIFTELKTNERKIFRNINL